MMWPYSCVIYLEYPAFISSAGRVMPKNCSPFAAEAHFPLLNLAFPIIIDDFNFQRSQFEDHVPVNFVLLPLINNKKKISIMHLIILFLFVYIFFFISTFYIIRVLN